MSNEERKSSVIELLKQLFQLRLSTPYAGESEAARQAQNRLMEHHNIKWEDVWKDDPHGYDD